MKRRWRGISNIDHYSPIDIKFASAIGASEWSDSHSDAFLPSPSLCFCSSHSAPLSPHFTLHRGSVPAGWSPMCPSEQHRRTGGHRGRIIMKNLYIMCIYEQPGTSRRTWVFVLQCNLHSHNNASILSHPLSLSFKVFFFLFFSTLTKNSPAEEM